MHFLSFLWFLLPLLSPLHTWVKFPSTWFPLPLPFPLRKQVEFPLIQFPLPLLLSMHGSSSPRLNSHSPLRFLSNMRMSYRYGNS
jgi:hypothetical protein